jgi:excisionase family DNA binding protein
MISPKQIAELVPVSYEAIVRAIRSGELRASKLRRRYAPSESRTSNRGSRSNVVVPRERPPARLRPAGLEGDFRARAKAARDRRHPR